MNCQTSREFPNSVMNMETGVDSHTVEAPCSHTVRSALSVGRQVAFGIGMGHCRFPKFSVREISISGLSELAKPAG